MIKISEDIVQFERKNIMMKGIKFYEDYFFQIQRSIISLGKLSEKKNLENRCNDSETIETVK